MKIGFIGLGNMGLPMAENLQKEGHKVTGFDIKKNINSNIRISNSIQEIVKGNKAIFTMLPSGKEVIAVYNDIINKCDSSTIMIDCSTIDIKSTDIIANISKKKWVTYFRCTSFRWSSRCSRWYFDFYGRR